MGRSGNVHISRENVLRKPRHGEAALPQEADQRLRSWGSLHRNFLPTGQTGHITDYWRTDQWFPFDTRLPIVPLQPLAVFSALLA